MAKLVLALALAPAAAFAPAAAPRTTTQLHARQPIIAGNWKLNPSSIQEADGLAKGVASLLGDETCASSSALASASRTSSLLLGSQPAWHRCHAAMASRQRKR